MAVTRSWTAAGAAPVMVARGRAAGRALGRRVAGWRRRCWWRAGLVVCLSGEDAAHGQAAAVLNLNAVASPEELLPVLEFFPDRTELAPAKFYDLSRAGAPAAQRGSADGGDSAAAVRARQAAVVRAHARGVSRANCCARRCSTSRDSTWWRCSGG